MCLYVFICIFFIDCCPVFSYVSLCLSKQMFLDRASERSGLLGRLGARRALGALGALGAEILKSTTPHADSACPGSQDAQNGHAGRPGRPDRLPRPQAGFLGPQAAFPGLPATPAGRPGPPQQDAPTGCPGFQAAQIGAQAAQIGFSGRPNCCNNLQECPCRQNNAPACKTFLLSTLLLSIKHRLVAMSNGPRQVSQVPRPPR